MPIIGSLKDLSHSLYALTPWPITSTPLPTTPLSFVIQQHILHASQYLPWTLVLAQSLSDPYYQHLALYRTCRVLDLALVPFLRHGITTPLISFLSCLGHRRSRDLYHPAACRFP